MALSPQRRYQNELARYGLGLGGLQFNPRKEKTLFAEEGPASALSGISGADNLAQKQVDSLVKRTGLSPEEVRKKLNRGIGVTNLPSDVSGMPELAKAYAAIMETVRPQDSLSLPDAAKIEAMPDDSPAFAESPLDAIANMIKKAESKTPSDSDQAASQNMIVKKEKDARAEDFRAKEKALVENFGSGDQTLTVEQSDEIFKNTYDGALADYIESVRGETPDTREQTIQQYKDEFAKATGVDVSGKVDKSSALMAMGLAMMQNKAGKGFNVANALSAVGAAGEKALPVLEKAKDRARQAKIASGKYALQMIKSDEDASASIESANKAFQRERYLKLLQMDADFEKERIKAGAKPVDIKNPYLDKIINGLEVRRGRGPIGSVFVAPEDALRDVAGALKSVNGALTTVDQMSGLVTSLANDESPSFEVIKETVESALVGAGLADAEIVFGDSKVGRNQQIRLLQDSIITQFKRMLTQETGNGISKSDVDNIRTMLGEINFLSNPQDALLRLKEVKTLFSGKRKAVRGVLDELQDPDYYPTTREYEKNMDLYPSLIEGSMEYSISNNQGSSIIDVKDS